MEQNCHQNSHNICPSCGFSRSWNIRRGHKRCKRCRKEWSPKFKINGFRATSCMWKKLIKSFLWDKTGKRVASSLNIERHLAHRMIHHLRKIMTRDVPEPFLGIVEIDETFVGGQWRNKPWSVRRFGTKRGHGTSKQAIMGILHRESGCVIAELIPNLKHKTLLDVIKRNVHPESHLYTDGWTGYLPVAKIYKHSQTDHQSGIYVLGEVHTNGIESFWGYLKRRLKTTGGIRKSRFHLYVGEEVWRFNHRHLTLEQQTEKLHELLVAE